MTLSATISGGPAGGDVVLDVAQLVTLDQLRDHVASDLQDDSMITLRDDAEAAVAGYNGKAPRAQRVQVVIALVKLSNQYRALRSETVGDYSAVYPAYARERRMLLSTLDIGRNPRLHMGDD